MAGQSWVVVVRLKVIVFVAPTAIVPKPQRSVPAATVQLAASGPARVHVPVGN